jgi:hypothetical protein
MHSGVHSDNDRKEENEMQKQTKTRTAAKPAQKPGAEVPDWLSQNPSELRYSLECTHVAECNAWDQQIDLTREEFIALKHCLAHIRGYAIPEVAHA